MAKKKTTARTNGLTGNQFASVEQGRSYVLSVSSPSGAGEIELLAADSDQQSEPDMFSLLYEKVETAKQIPFVAVSSFVFVNVGSSDTQYLITPANFSLAVSGASSGDGFDPTMSQYITGNYSFHNKLTRDTKANPVNTDVMNRQMTDALYVPKSGDSAISGVKTFTDTITVTNINIQDGYFRDILRVGEAVNIVSGSSGNAILAASVLGTIYDMNDSVVRNTSDNDLRYIKYLELTEADYKALRTKSNSTIYYLTDKNMWAIGDKELVTSDMPA